MTGTATIRATAGHAGGKLELIADFAAEVGAAPSLFYWAGQRGEIDLTRLGRHVAAERWQLESFWARRGAEADHG